MKNITYILAFAFALLLAGCESINPETCQDWGKQVHYSDFWFKKFVPDTLYKTLNIDADGEIAQNVELQLYKKDGKQVKAVPTSEVQLFADGAICPNNVICILPHTKSVRVGLVFTKEAQRGDYKWYLKVKNGGDVEVLNGYDLTDNASKEIFEWQAKKQVKMNPLANGIMLGGIGLVILLLLWLFISRVLIWPSTKFSTLYMDYCDGYGQKSIPMAGKYELVCTNNAKMKDSALRVFFVGKRQFEYNDFWTEPVTIKTGARANSVRIIKTHNFDFSGDLKRREVIEIINADGKSVKLETT